MSLFKKIFNTRKKSSTYRRSRALRRGRKVYKAKTIRITPDPRQVQPKRVVTQSPAREQMQKVSPQPVVRKAKPVVQKKPASLPPVKKVSITSSKGRAERRQTLDLRNPRLKKPEKGALVLALGFLSQVIKSIGLVLAAGSILLWNGVVAVVEFVLETAWDILFMLKKAGVVVLGFSAALAAYIFAGIKIPTFKLPKIELPDVRIPKLDLDKEDRSQVPYVSLQHEEIPEHATTPEVYEPQVEVLPTKSISKDILAKIWSVLLYKFPLPDYLTKHRNVPVPTISIPQVDVLTKQHHILPKGPSFKQAGMFLWALIVGVFGVIAAGGRNMLSTLFGFTYKGKTPKIEKRQAQDLTPPVRAVPRTRREKFMAAATKHKQTRIGLFFHRMVILGFILGFLVLGAFFIWVATLEIPELGNFADRQLRESTKIYDKTGEVLLYDVFKEERRTVIPLQKVSVNLQHAILATEDDKFYEHHGVRPMALVRSIVDKIKNPEKRLAGGSTITQQVIKNAILTNERAIERKVKEWVLAWRLENQLSKEEILEAYFNEIAFGGSVYGVEQAARSFYGKSASEVSIAEAAYIAAVPKAPTFYSPYGSNKDRLDGRQQYILGRMKELGFISDQEYTDALREEVVFVVREDKGIKAPHFVFHVIEYLETQYGAETIEKGGLKVITTLDWELQKGLEEVTAEYATQLGKFKASNLATVAIEAQTGKIIGMVGSKDYFSEDIDGKFNVATAFRQPGSTFKPFVYAQAFEIGYTPQTVLWDVKTEFSPSCYPDGTPQLPQYADRCYSPKNYDNSTRGPISMQSALAQSLNIPAVKTLYLTGVGNAIQTAKKLGITGLNRSASYYGLNLVLGGGEVRLLDMTSAYAVFANDGNKNAPVAIMRIEDKNGNELETYEKKETRVLTANVARMINSILSQDNLKKPTFGSRSVLYHDGVQVAVKTGTTNSFKDTWTVGYTPDVSVGVWIGNNDNTPMAERPSSVVAAPYWRKAMDKARARYKQTSFIAPVYKDPSTQPPVLNGVWQGSERFFINTETGFPADATTPSELREEKYLIDYRSILHRVEKRNPLGGGTSQGDALYQNWEQPIADWARAAGFQTSEEQASVLTGGLVGTTTEETEDVPGTNASADNTSDRDTPPTVDFEITTPISFEAISADQRQDIEIKITGPTRDVDRIFYYVNNTYLGSGTFRETSTSFVPSSIRTIQDTNIIRVIVQTDDGTRIEKETVFQIQ